MFQVCIHGRGGQGVVTAAELLARAAFSEGHYTQAIPSFGSERTGAPVVSYCRISAEPILTREPISAPDAVIVQDPTLLRAMDPFAGIAEGGWAVVNTRLSPKEVREIAPGAPTATGRLATVPADDIVREYLGRPIPSMALLGAFAALTGQISLQAVFDVINSRFKGKVAIGNVTSAEIAHTWVLEHVADSSAGAHEGIPVPTKPHPIPEAAELPTTTIGAPEVRNA